MKSDMKILVTGATGFVGRSLLPLLRSQGHEVVVLTRDPKTAGVRLPIHCQVLQWNPEQGPPPAEAFENVDAVVHLAGENIAGGRWTDNHKHDIRESRIVSSQQLVDAIGKLENKPRVLVSASAVGFYGDRGDEVLHESSPVGEGFLANVCEEWEREVQTAEKYSVRTVSLRFGVVLGQGGALSKMLPPFRLGLGGPLGHGRQWMSWIHVQDLAGIILRAIEQPELMGPVNAVAPNPVSNQEFTQTLGKVLHRPTILPMPAFVLKLALGDMTEILLSGQRVSSEKIEDSGYQFIYSDLESALRSICEQKGHELILEQWVSYPQKEVFDFFSEAKNLELLTPPYLKFKIIRLSTAQIEKDTRLDYRLQLHGIRFNWQSLITDWQPGIRFSDKQTKGPYAFWEHTHEFSERDGGTVIRDCAVYEVPLGALGDILLHPFIRKDLEKIFAYRRTKIEELFPQDGETITQAGGR
jgi:uncharacterized protein (TIGR01777 family)